MSKERDKRQILAAGYFYHPGSDTYGKKTKSCIKAGYAETYAEKHARKILGLDAAEDTLPLEWRKTIDLLPQTRELIKNWLKRHKDKPETKDIKEARGLLRLYGELEHRFEKIERRIEHKIDEKRAVIIYDTSEEHRKAIQEKIAVLSSQLERIDSEIKDKSI